MHITLNTGLPSAFKSGLYAGLMLIAAPALAQMAPMSSDMPMPATTKAPAYVAAAGAGDLYEKTSSQIVLKDAKNAKVRMFAQMMVSDHAKTTMEVTAAAKASGMKPMPLQLNSKQTQMIADLKAAPASAREKLYLNQQVMAHAEALALHQGYAANGDTPALMKVAAGAVPIVQHHLDMVKALDTAM